MFLSVSLFLHLLASPNPGNFPPIGKDTLVTNSLLYNGAEYTKTYTLETGDPFLPIDATTGNILYEGNWYQFQDFYYDCEEDVLVLKDQEGYFRIQLVREKTQAFQWQSRAFVKLNFIEGKEAFYEQAYVGKRTLLIRWKKSLESNNDAQSKYKLSNRIFLQLNDHFTEIKKPEDWFNLLGPSAKPARQWLKSQGISLKKDMLKGSITLLHHFETVGW